MHLDLGSTFDCAVWLGDAEIVVHSSSQPDYRHRKHAAALALPPGRRGVRIRLHPDPPRHAVRAVGALLRQRLWRRHQSPDWHQVTSSSRHLSLPLTIHQHERRLLRSNMEVPRGKKDIGGGVSTGLLDQCSSQEFLLRDMLPHPSAVHQCEGAPRQRPPSQMSHQWGTFVANFYGGVGFQQGVRNECL